MPEIRPEEISLATCDAAGWNVSLSCAPCRCMFPIQIEPLRRHPKYRRPFVWIAQETRPVFRCNQCKTPAEKLFVSRRGDGEVYSLALLKTPTKPEP